MNFIFQQGKVFSEENVRHLVRPYRAMAPMLKHLLYRSNLILNELVKALVTAILKKFLISRSIKCYPHIQLLMGN